MSASKPKQKPNLGVGDVVAQVKAYADRAMQFLFGVEPDWYKQLDLVKNNYRLGLNHFRQGHVHDAMLRLKVVTWLDKGAADPWYYLGRTYLAQGKRALAEQALKQALARKAAYPGVDKILVALPEMFAKEPPAIVLNEVKASDAATLSAIHRDSFIVGWDEKAVTELFTGEGTVAWVTGLAQLPMGMLVARALADEYEIITMAVLPEWRGRGLAKLLLNHVINAAQQKKSKAIFLEVAEDNKPAQDFYQQAGFSVMNRRKDYYRRPGNIYIDALVMRKELA